MTSRPSYDAPHLWACNVPNAGACFTPSCGCPCHHIDYAPRYGLDRIEDQQMPEDHGADPGDTMPAQGWLIPSGTYSDPHLVTDAGRLPAPREERTMNSSGQQGTILHAEVRLDFGHAADRAQTVDNYAEMDPQRLLDSLEALPVTQLRELHHLASGVESWHEQGAREARNLSQSIGRMLRSAGDEIAPQNEAAKPTGYEATHG